MVRSATPLDRPETQIPAQPDVDPVSNVSWKDEDEGGPTVDPGDKVPAVQPLLVTRYNVKADSMDGDHPCLRLYPMHSIRQREGNRASTRSFLFQSLYPTRGLR